MVGCDEKSSREQIGEYTANRETNSAKIGGAICYSLYNGVFFLFSLGVPGSEDLCHLNRARPLHEFGCQAHQTSAAATLALHVHLQSHLACLLDSRLFAGALGNLAIGCFVIKELMCTGEKKPRLVSLDVFPGSF